MNIKYSYTANTSNTKPEWLLRGYTGHEHLPEFNLINMNGRMYDPLIARMLSPDNYVQEATSTQAYNRYSYAYNNPLKYTDPTGNYAIVDDLIAGGIGGVINWASNGFQFNAKGLGYFGAGFAAGDLALYGPVGWAAGGAILRASNTALGGRNGNQILQEAVVGVFSGVVGGVAGQWAAQGLGGVVINGFNITSPVVKGIIGGTIGGAAGGYAGGFTGEFIMTGDIGAANQAGIQGLVAGVGVGATTGVIAGYAAAKKAGINPWTGKADNSVTIGEGMKDRVEPISKDLGSFTIKFPEGMKSYQHGDPTPEGLQYNAEWIEMQMQNDVYIYDIGARGSQPASPYYNLELNSISNYSKTYQVYHWQQIQTIRVLIIYK